jgi:restriction system protein
MRAGNSGCLGTIGVIALLGMIAKSPGLVVLVGLIALVGGGLWLAVKLSNERAVRRTADDTVQQHIDALVRRRAQLLTSDAYGAVVADKWTKEIRYFHDTQIAPRLNVAQRKIVDAKWGAIGTRIDALVVAAAEARPAFHETSVEGLSPLEFEAYCAERLRQTGWNAYATRGSGDQGVDVVAERPGLRVALQCKLYTGPVGNKAVQEIAAGRVLYGAQRAAVFSNRSYTPAAQQLAQINGVLLLHHTQLGELAMLLGPAATVATLPPSLPMPTTSPVAEPRAVAEPLRIAPTAPARSSFGLRR